MTGVFGSDVVTLSAAKAVGLFVDRHVGVDKKVAITGLTLAGADAANYSNDTSAAVAKGTITVRPLSIWIGPTSGQWGSAANWDALPDGSNVLAASIPTGVSVVYDAGVGATTLQSLSSGGAFAMQGGSLSVASALSFPDFTQSGGSILAGGALTVNQSNGTLSVGSLTAPSIILSAPNGDISQNGALVTTGLLRTLSGASTVLNSSGNRVAAFKATTTGTGNVELTNVGVLDVQGINVAKGSVVVSNTGGVRTSGAVAVRGGGFKGLANSPFTVGASGLVADGNVDLTASNLTSSGNMTLDGNVTSTAGAVSLTAANDFVQNGAVSAALGVTVTAGGRVVLGSLASTDRAPVTYLANGTSVTPPITRNALLASQIGGTTDFIASFLSNFEKALTAQEDAISDPLKKRNKDKDGFAVEGEICAR